jgi:hypothetical protein
MMKNFLLLITVFLFFGVDAAAQWQYSKTQDRMTDKVTHKLTLRTASARLEVHCEAGKYYAYFYIASGRMKTETQDTGRGITFDGANVRTRLDQEKADTGIVAFMDNLNRGGMLTLDVEDMLKAKRLLVEYELASGHEKIATFNLTGLGEAMKKTPCGKS